MSVSLPRSGWLLARCVSTVPVSVSSSGIPGILLSPATGVLTPNTSLAWSGIRDNRDYLKNPGNKHFKCSREMLCFILCMWDTIHQKLTFIVITFDFKHVYYYTGLNSATKMHLEVNLQFSELHAWSHIQFLYLGCSLAEPGLSLDTSCLGNISGGRT